MIHNQHGGGLGRMRGDYLRPPQQAQQGLGQDLQQLLTLSANTTLAQHSLPHIIGYPIASEHAEKHYPGNQNMTLIYLMWQVTALATSC